MAGEGSAGRLFIGIPFPAELRDGLSAYLRETFAEGMPGKPVPPQNWHVTVRFLGDSSADQHRTIMDMLREMDLGRPFRLAFDGLGAFPRLARATVLWIGAAEGANALRELADCAEKAAARAGYPPENKPFSPHLTLSRINPPADVRTAVSGAPPFGGTMDVTEIVIFRSHLGSGPPRYESILRVPLT